MAKKSSLLESIIYYGVKVSGAVARALPVEFALWCGRRVGDFVYMIDIKHKAMTYANLNKAFAGEKSPGEIRQIAKDVFRNIGQNIVELYRLPLIDRKLYDTYIDFQGRDNIDAALEKGNGCILLAMHFGSWEMANLSCAMYGYPYKVLVRKQPKFSRLDDLLNQYRTCNGSIVIARGAGTRDLVKSLKNNEVVGMVVDQGGRGGELVPFFGRNASMSVGAIRMALKFDVPICFSVIVRQKGPYHKIVVHKPFELKRTGDPERDVSENLSQLIATMEQYTRNHPTEYVWMYKVWKYSDQANILILSDGKTGHLRQSEKTAQLLEQALAERDIKCRTETVNIKYRNDSKKRAFGVFYKLMGWSLAYGGVHRVQPYLTDECYRQITSIRPDYIISTGSSVASLNHLLSKDHQAKSICILKPGLLSTRLFNLVLMPKHDVVSEDTLSKNITVIRGAPNLITKEYLKTQTDLLLKRYSHLKDKFRTKIGILIGGDARNLYISEEQIKMLIRQVSEAAQGLNAEVFVTTSRRTPPAIDQYLFRKVKKDPRFPLLILPNREDVPEAVGGILGLCDILIVSGDSISMVSEAASSGKKTIVFLPKFRDPSSRKSSKHFKFVEGLNKQGFILSSRTKDIGQAIFDIAKQKIHTRPLDESPPILESLRKLI